MANYKNNWPKDKYWTDMEVETLKALKSQRWTHQQIGSWMGKTRDAISGKWRRLNELRRIRERDSDGNYHAVSGGCEHSG